MIGLSSLARPREAGVVLDIKLMPVPLTLILTRPPAGGPGRQRGGTCLFFI
jgi:hypothetical protein